MSLGYKILLYKPYCPCFLEEKKKSHSFSRTHRSFLQKKLMMEEFINLFYIFSKEVLKQDVTWSVISGQLQDERVWGRRTEAEKTTGKV